MIDSNAVINQVQSGTAPTSWQVFRARRGYFVQSAILRVVAAILAVAVAVYLFMSGTVFGYGINDQTSDNVLTFWLIVDMLVLASVLIYSIVTTFTHLISLGSVEGQMLVLMPEGFVMRQGTSAKSTRLVLFENVATLVPTVSSGSVSLVMRTRNRRKLRIPLDGRFGKAKQVAQHIQGMHAAYAHTAANVRQS